MRKFMNKIVTALAVATLTVPVLAVSTSTPSTEFSFEAKPADIIVTVPVGGISFNIDPNAKASGGKTFTASTLTITNNSCANVDMVIESIKSKEGTTMKIRDQAKYKDWNRIGAKQSGESIAMHWIKNGEDSRWIRDEIEVEKNGNEQHRLSKLGGSLELSLGGLHGLSMTEPTNQEYTINFMFTLAGDTVTP